MLVESSAVNACDVVLKDGSTVGFRAARPEDAPAVREFFEAMSPDSRYQRFHGLTRLNDARVMSQLGSTPGSCALLAVCGRRIVAVAGFYSSADGDPHAAEVAFAIADAFQGRGIATRLLERLAEIGRAAGLERFDAFVRGDNARMIEVFADSGFTLTQKVSGGLIHVRLSLERSPAFTAKAAVRAQTAAAASMRPFFEPRAVTVVGASRTRGKIGSEILANLLAAGYAGTLTAIHPEAREVQGVPAYPRVSDVPGPVDLAVVAVPAAHVLPAIDDCIAKGVRGICVISAGFAESGADGPERETELLDKVRAAGCRLIGPNCMGLLNTDGAIRLNATFSPVYPPAGNVAMSTQSGALGLAILDYARRLNVGISSFVSVGNKADVSSNDLMQYWADDPHTSVILLYLESFGNPRKFTEIARRVSRSKPIVAVKSGRSSAGARAASSHTGALAASDAVVDALFRQAGVIRTDTLQELFDVAALLSNQPLPAGPRVAIVTNAGGPGILAADACEAHGLTLAALSEGTREKLRSFLPPAASVGNPVDMIASAPAADFRRALSAVLHDDAVDAVIAIFIPPIVTETEAVASAIVEAAREASAKPVLGVFMRAEGAPAALSPIPCYAFPESAAIALSRVVGYAAWRRAPAGVVPTHPDIDPEKVKAPVAAALARGGGWLSAAEVSALLSATGIPYAENRLATSVEEAQAAAAGIGAPVAVKALGPTLLHKTERRAVALDLRDAPAVRSAVEDLASRLGDDVTGYLVQRMVPDGIEMLVGAISDPLFGPVIVCGSGGVLAELVADSASRLHPLTAADAAGMVGELRAMKLLRGYRGAAASDVPALQDALLRLSSLLTICPEIQELDINPLKVLNAGVCAVDARIRVGSAAPRRTRRVEY